VDFTEQGAAAAVADSFSNTPDPRLRELLTSLARHLHAFVREVEPTIAEWEQAIDFLTRTGHTCDATRQEFILLSDVLGVSMLVETINARRGAGPAEGTPSTVLGPFHVTQSPPREHGDTLDETGTGRPCVVTGQVRDTAGAPLPGARVDVWQCDEHGFYDVQQPGVQPAGNGRGLFTAGAEGRFWFRTVVPSHYPIPADGPVGELLKATRRHPYRPAHIHFIADAPGHQRVTTHFFVAGSPYLDSDAVFAVKQSLITDFAEVDDPAAAARFGVTAPFRHATVALVLPASG
jgi:catechol 1,2-dioxygenase/hydroxyquinol 1,2-dioxygenase